MAFVLHTLAIAMLSQNLLDQSTLVNTSGLTRVEVLHDNQLTFEGDNWNTEWTTLLAKDARVVFQFAKPTHIGAALIQGDNNDTYTLSGSLDGVNFVPLFVSKGDPLAGMRTRTNVRLDSTISFLQLTATGGDGLFSIGELAVYDTAQALESANLVRQKKPERLPRAPPQFDTSWLVLAAVVGFLAWYFAGLPRKTAAGKNDA
jgi:hypothetical protein